MEIDPLLEIEHRFRYKFAGKKVADLLKDGGQLMGGPDGADFIAYELDEIADDKMHVFDLVLMRDFKREDLNKWSPVAWRILKPGGWLYIGSAGKLPPHWAGWSLVTFDAVGFEMHSIYVKKIPDGFPFKIGTTADSALFIVKKTDRITKRKPEQLGKDSNGMIVKWFLSDCTLYLKRLAYIAPYKIVDIGPREVPNQRERKESADGRLALERNRA